MPVQFQNPLFNCDYIKVESYLESKSTKSEKLMLIKQMYLVAMVTLKLKYSEVFFSLYYCCVRNWIVDYQLMEP
jgi:hypothetical protein